MGKDGSVESGSGTQSTFRLLIVAAEAVAGEQVREAIAERAGERAAEVRLIAPALAETALENMLGDVDDARAAAQERVEQSLEELRRVGLEADGGVGDSDLRLAIQDALQTFDADEILIVAHEDGGPHTEARGIEEAEQGFDRPITELFVARDRGPEPRVADVERVEAGEDRGADAGEAEGQSRNLPPFSVRDVLGIIVALLGTAVLVILAANCGDGELFNQAGGFGNETGGGFTSCSALLLIAGIAGLVNLAHVVGLMLFQAGPYRGVWRTFFARLSLYGTPVALAAGVVLLLAGD